MALWGNKDNKTGSGTIAIVGATGVVTGSATPAFDTELKIGNTITVSGEDYNITKIASASSMTVAPGVRGATMTDRSSITTGNWYVSEKPAFVAASESGDTSGDSGDSTKVYGVDTTEKGAGSDNVTAIAIASAGARYIGTDNSSTLPTVSFSGGGGSSAAAAVTIASNAISTITLSNSGSSYTSAPTIAITKPRRTIVTGSMATTVTYTGHLLVAGDVVVYQNGGGASATGLTSGTTYYVIATGLTANAFQVSATSGGAAVTISGTGNSAQYFELQGTSDAATAVASLGAGSGTLGPAHAGWVRRTVGTGGRAGRVQYEVLVASGSINADAPDDLVFPDA